MRTSTCPIESKWATDTLPSILAAYCARYGLQVDDLFAVRKGKETLEASQNRSILITATYDYFEGDVSHQTIGEYFGIGRQHSAKNTSDTYLKIDCEEGDVVERYAYAKGLWVKFAAAR